MYHVHGSFYFDNNHEWCTTRRLNSMRLIYSMYNLFLYSTIFASFFLFDFLFVFMFVLVLFFHIISTWLVHCHTIFIVYNIYSQAFSLDAIVFLLFLQFFVLYLQFQQKMVENTHILSWLRNKFKQTPCEE